MVLGTIKCAFESHRDYMEMFKVLLWLLFILVAINCLVTGIAYGGQAIPNIQLLFLLAFSFSGLIMYLLKHNV